MYFIFNFGKCSIKQKMQKVQIVQKCKSLFLHFYTNLVITVPCTVAFLHYCMYSSIVWQYYCTYVLQQ